MKLKILVFITTIFPVAGWSQNTFPTSGNVGIGTTSPGGPLDIKSDAGNGGRTNQIFVEGASDPSKRLYFGINTTSDFASIEYVRESAHWGPLALQADGGYVGIGTTTPAAKLEVHGASGQAAGRGDIFANAENSFIGVDNGSSRLGFVKQWGNVPVIGGDSSTPIVFGHFNVTNLLGNISSGTGFTEKMRITSNGNVGIGTASPSQALEVSGTIQSNASYPFIIGTTGYAYFPANTSHIAYFRQHGSYEFYWRASNDGRPGGAPDNEVTLMALNDSRLYVAGSIGIGTINPTYPLTVNGAVRAKEVIVDTGWSDYVFDEHYKLAPLSEVESHIKAEKHLPGIPSAQQVAEHGISLGEMQAKLLAKIEELTLHQIEQEKEISAVRAENRDLRSELQGLRAQVNPQ